MPYETYMFGKWTLDRTIWYQEHIFSVNGYEVIPICIHLHTMKFFVNFALKKPSIFHGVYWDL